MPQSYRFPRPYLLIPSALFNSSLIARNIRLQKCLQDLQQRVQQKQKWEEAKQVLSDKGTISGRLAKSHCSDSFRVLIALDEARQCAWVCEVYHKGEEQKRLAEVKGDIEGYIAAKKAQMMVEEELGEVLAEKRKEEEEKHKKPTLSKEDKEWLDFTEGFMVGTESQLIMESITWVEDVHRRGKDFLKALRQALRQLLSHNLKETLYESPFEATNLGWIHFRWLPSIVLPSKKQINVLYLCALSQASPSAAESLPDECTLSDTLDWDDLAKRARRTYYSEVLENEDLWVTLEKEEIAKREGEAATLAFSAEELELLGRITQQQLSMPLFINGRAGSGKTTLLFWLFAEYLLQAWDWYRKYRKEARLRFLTYSEDLRDVARDQLRTILKIHPFARMLNVSAELEKVLQDSILTFREFLLGEVTKLEIEPGTTFSSLDYIDFPRFRREYKKCYLPQCKHFTPEQVWFAVRALILGYDAEEEMTPERYAEIFHRDPIFSQEELAALYEIYQRWYQRQPWWNEIDLARFLLRQRREGLLHPHYHLIMVDEAQDFTRVEFQLLLNLLYWTQFRLSKEEWRRVPLIFAGDPFQTINPTGFRWAYVKDIFNEAIQESGLSFLRLQTQDLKLNYRATQPLVCLANAILAWRQDLFEEREKGNPFPFQSTWSAKKSAQRPTLYPFEENALRDRLPKKFIVLTPWDAQHPQRHKWEALKPYNTLSPQEAKGLEYNQIILADFGLAWGQLKNQKKQKTDRLKERFFWAQLYVAATRAREHILIVEEEEGRKFWEHFFLSQSPPFPQEVPSKEAKKELEECKRSILEAKDVEDFGLEEESWLSLAENDLERARQNADPILYERAAKAFQNALEQDEVDDEDERKQVKKKREICRFYAALLRASLDHEEQAAEEARSILQAMYQRNLLKPQTSQEDRTLVRNLLLFLWQEQKWADLLTIAQGKVYPDENLNAFLQLIAQFMLNQDAKSALDLLDWLLDAASSPFPVQHLKPHDDLRSEQVLQEGLKRWLEVLKHIASTSQPPSKSWGEKFAANESLREHLGDLLGYENVLTSQGEILFALGRKKPIHRSWLRQACDLWEQANRTTLPNYAHAQALLAQEEPHKAFHLWVKARQFEQAWHVYHSIAKQVKCQHKFWQNKENRNALKALFLKKHHSLKPEEVLHWLNCFWRVDHQEALQFWLEAYKIYKPFPTTQTKLEGWLARHIEKGGFSSKDLQRVREALSISPEHPPKNPIRRAILKAVAREPHMLEQILEETEKWLKGTSDLRLLLQDWGKALQEAEQKNRLEEWLSLQRHPTTWNFVDKGLQKLLKHLKLPQDLRSPSSLWLVYRWAADEKAEERLWYLLTTAYQESTSFQRRGFFLEQIYQQRRIWHTLPIEERCRFVEHVYQNLFSEKKSKRVPSHLIEQVAVLAEWFCESPERRAKLLEQLASLPYISKKLRTCLSQRSQGWKEKRLTRPLENASQLCQEETKTFSLPAYSSDDIALMLHGRENAAQRLLQWYRQAKQEQVGAAKARERMIQELLQETKKMNLAALSSITQETLRNLLKEALRDQDIPASLHPPLDSLLQQLH